MEALGIIIACSTIIWYIVDRFRPLWDDLKYGKYVTMAIVAILGIIAVVTFSLDILVATGIVPDVTVFGQICTVLLLMGGSSCIAEIIHRIKGDER